MSDLRVKVGTQLTDNVKTSIQNELNKIKNLSVHIEKVTVNTSAIKSEIEKAVKDAVNGVNLGSVKLPSLGSKGTSGIANQYQKEYQQLLKLQRDIGSLKFQITGLDASKNKSEIATLTQQLSEFEKDYNSLLKSIGGNLSTDQWGKLQAVIESTEDKIATFKSKTLDGIKFDIDTEGYSTEINKITTQLSKYGELSGGVFKEAKTSADALTNTYRQMQDAFGANASNYTDEQRIQIEQRYQQELTKTKNLLAQLNADKDNEIVHVGDSKRVNMISTLNNYLVKNTAMTKASKDEIQRWIDKLSSSDDMTVGAIKSINTEFKRLDSQLRATGKLGLSWTDKVRNIWEKFGGWSIVTGTMMKVKQEFVDAVKVMKEVDSELVNIQKVTNATAEEMKELTKQAYAMATAYGRSPVEFLKSVTEFSRAGYGETASQLGELSLLTQNVGDVEEELADKFLISTDAAWQYGGNIEKLRAILDGFNELSNKTATNVENLADGITVAGSVFAQAGLTAEDYAGIVGTATAKTQLSGNEMARAWRTILMNIRQIRGTDLETGEVIDADKLADAEATLNSIGISIREVVNGQNELRNPMSILTELAEKWKDLNSVQQSAIQEALAGRLLPERIEMCA